MKSGIDVSRGSNSDHELNDNNQPLVGYFNPQSNITAELNQSRSDNGECKMHSIRHLADCIAGYISGHQGETGSLKSNLKIVAF